MTGKKQVYGIAFVLFLLMLCKVSAFHVYTHQNESADNIENCSVCDVAIENQHSESDFSLVYGYSPILFTELSTKNAFNTNFRFYTKVLQSRYYCRPPPNMV